MVNRSAVNIPTKRFDSVFSILFFFVLEAICSGNSATKTHHGKRSISKLRDGDILKADTKTESKKILISSILKDSRANRSSGVEPIHTPSYTSCMLRLDRTSTDRYGERSSHDFFFLSIPRYLLRCSRTTVFLCVIII